VEDLGGGEGAPFVIVLFHLPRATPMGNMTEMKAEISDDLFNPAERRKLVVGTPEFLSERLYVETWKRRFDVGLLLFIYSAKKTYLNICRVIVYHI
jgi:hypothetical protein